MSHSTLVFIDPNVADYQTLIDAIPADAEVMILDGTRNGLEQITERLELAENIAAIHIISHGEKGRFKLGQDTIDEQQLEIYRPQLQQWQNFLTANADILLYGCDIASEPPLTPPFEGGEPQASEPPLTPPFLKGGNLKPQNPPY